MGEQGVGWRRVTLGVVCLGSIVVAACQKAEDQPDPEFQSTNVPVSENVYIRVDADGSISVNGERITQAELDEFLARARSCNQVHVEADQSAEYRSVAEVMAKVQELDDCPLGVVGSD